MTISEWPGHVGIGDKLFKLSCLKIKLHKSTFINFKEITDFHVACQKMFFARLVPERK